MQWWWARRRVHVSWLIMAACVCFVIGVWAVQYVLLGFWWVAIVGLILLCAGFFRGRVYSFFIVASAGCLLGLWYGSQARGDLSVYASFIDTRIIIQGKVKEDPTTSTSSGLVMQLDGLSIKGVKTSGTLWVSTRERVDVKRGDIVTVKGVFEEGFGTFAGMMRSVSVEALERPVPGDIGRVFRDWFASAVRLGIPEPQASLGIGYLTGQKSALPDDLAESLRIAGLTHIVVASGYNLTILVRLARKLFMRVSKFTATLASSLMITSFIMVTGLSPSMTRAGLVAGLSLAAWYYGRQFHPIILLSFAAAVTVIWQPSYAWGDLGWQLSFAAFAGVMILAPLLQRYFFGDAPPGTIRQVLGETISAHIVTIPIIAPAFGVLSNVAVPANMLIVPLVPLAMLLTFIVGVVGLVAPMMIEIVGLPVTWLLTYMTSVATYLAELPWAQLEVSLSWWVILLYVVVVISVCVYLWKKTGFSVRSVNILD